MDVGGEPSLPKGSGKPQDTSTASIMSSPTNPQSTSARDLFLKALEFSGVDRDAYLRQACGTDEKLRAQVEELLRCDQDDSFLDGQAPGLEETILESAVPLTEGPGTVIGRYKLLQQIGEGGMGVVYMAEQELPVRRRVALKIIKLGMDSRAVIARFEAERQALALMDHPSIARVLDGGTTDTGRPYFVMELVQGVPITEYCDKNRLPAAERLKLFVGVCHAIQSAHQKGIIHRDIKPSNVLVTIEHGEPMPKVIDFGIAKATNQKLTEKTLFTNYATMIGTPAYMSPEQAEMTSLDIDTRADIYSLGVLLYELLTGTTPFPAERLRSLGYGAMQRVILEEEPERPSTRLSTMAQEQKSVVANNRGNDLPGLGALLRGDLDWIVMRCLEKDRRRRYDTANGLAVDLQRHLNNEPVLARPPAATYRIQKWFRRNRAMAVATGMVALALVGAAAFSTIAFLKERKARLQAAHAERAREDARRATEAESIRAENLAGFAIELVEGVVPPLRRNGHQESVRKVLQIAGQLADKLTNAPLAQARVHLVVARGFDEHLYDYREAIARSRIAENLVANLGPAGKLLLEDVRLVRVKSVAYADNGRNDQFASDLIAFGKEVLRTSPESSDIAASAFAAAAVFYASMENADLFPLAEDLAHEAIRYSSGSPLGSRIRLNAYRYLVMIASNRRDSAKAIEMADRYFDLLVALVKHPDPRMGESAARDLDELWDVEFDVFPEQSLARALAKLPVEAAQTRKTVLALRGVAMAKAGDWEGGLKVLEAGQCLDLRPGTAWQIQLILSRLLEDSLKVRQLAVLGLTRFGNGADSQRIQVFVWTLLGLVRDPAFSPVVSDFYTNALPAAKESFPGLAPALTAAFTYYLGRYDEAEKNLGVQLGLIRTGTLGPFMLPETKSWASFLQACIAMHLGKVREAEEAYAEGLKLHDPSLSKPGKPYQGRMWSVAVEAELMRREAAGLLGKNAKAP